MAFVNKATAFPAGEDASGREHVVVKGVHATLSACDTIEAGISTASLKAGLIAGVDQVFLQLVRWSDSRLLLCDRRGAHRDGVPVAELVGRRVSGDGI